MIRKQPVRGILVTIFFVKLLENLLKAPVKKFMFSKLQICLRRNCVPVRFCLVLCEVLFCLILSFPVFQEISTKK